MDTSAIRTRIIRGASTTPQAETHVRLPGVVRGTNAPPTEVHAQRLTRIVRAQDARLSARPARIADLTGEVAHALPSVPDEVDVGDLHAPSTDLAFEAGIDTAPAAPPPPVDIEALREEIAAEWRERMDEEVEKARDDGYRQGHSDTLRTHQRKFEQDRATLSADVAALAAARSKLLTDSEELAARLAFDVAESILGAAVPDAARRASMGALNQALDQIAADQTIVATLHPVDLLRLSENGLSDEMQAAHSGLKLEADPLLEEGDWHLATPDAVVRRVRSELLGTLRRRLGLLSMAG